MNKNYVDKNTGIVYYKLPQSCDAKFLIVAAEGGKVVEINHFGFSKMPSRSSMKLQMIMA